MKRKLFIPMLAMALAFTSCSSEEHSAAENGAGKVRLGCVVSETVAEVKSRAGQFQLPDELLPATDQLTLTISGSYTSKTDGTLSFHKEWLTVADFVIENPDFESGDYNTSESHYQNSYQAALTYGEPDEEGEGKAYFEGTSEAFCVYAGETTPVNATVKLANSCFTLAVTEWMLNYYDGVKLTIHTSDDNSFTFEPTTTAQSALIFVKAGSTLSLSGSAVNAQTGVEINFPKTALGKTTEAATKYDITIDHGTAGGGSLKISFSDTFTEVDGEEVELNPDGN